MSTPTINILAISGSLRANSSNNAVINAAAQFAPANVNFTIYNGLGALPHFDDSKEPAPEVIDLRNQLRAADGVLISSPEYAFGVPGVLKNALDWTVSSGEFVNKPLALITAATGGSNAHASLLLTFTALSATLPPENQLLISFIRAKMKDDKVTDPATLKNIESVMLALIETIKSNLS
jgi:chromate reductase, NAD(P)H dehydrogenase (quinone)